MSVFKTLFSQLSGKLSNTPIEVLAKDMSKSAEERGSDIAYAYNPARNPRAYYDFRDQKLYEAEKLYATWKDIHVLVDNLREANGKHSKNVWEQVRARDDAALLKNAPRLQSTAADVNLLRHQALKAIEDARRDLDRMKDTFQMLAAAEDKMMPLRESEKKHTPQTLIMLQKQADEFRQLAGVIPPENKDAEKAITKIREDEITRANQQREAIAAAEAARHKIKFNEYLNTGLSTASAIKAPGTARFTRKPKAVQTVGP